MPSPDAVVFQLNNGLNNGGGFFSVFFFMCTAYLHAKSLGVPFFIEHVKWPYTVREGWHDYFTTLKVKPVVPRYPNSLRSGHMVTGVHPQFTAGAYSQCIRELFQLRPELIERVNRLREHIGHDYTAIFVRRGDKSRETAPTPFAEILPLIPYTSSTVFFIQTDDYTVVEEAEACLPGRRIVSTVPPTKRGSYHSNEFLKDDTRNKYKSSIVSLESKSRQAVWEETSEMLVGLTVCLLAPSCWTDVTSNVGRFLKIANPSAHTYPRETPVDPNGACNPAFGL
jgi:hypothetical protein